MVILGAKIVSNEEKSNFEYSLSAAALSMLVFKMQNITLTL